MRRLPISQLAHYAGGELHGDDVAIDAVSNDTRTLAAGSLYVALRGERFDGHDFAESAAKAGASALLVERLLPLELPQIVVDDSERALARLAAGLQRGRGTRVVALTGSNGKTSVKALVCAILERAGQTYASPGNRNNEIGLPLAVIDAPDEAEFAVYEMGAGKPGDIAYLTDIAAPDVALVNNIAPAHLERMGSLLGVAHTKGAIYSTLRQGGTAVINADDAFGAWFDTLAAGRKVLRFGLDSSAEIRARILQATPESSRLELITPAGTAEVLLPLPGRHSVLNALAAVGLALGCGVTLETIVEGLQSAEPVKGRQIAKVLRNGAVLVDDSYNANPGSLAAAIDSLAVAGKQGWLVLGDMRELGPEGPALHAQAGLKARAAGLGRLYALGELAACAAHAFGEGGRVFESHAALAQALVQDLRPGVRCLVKGSRGSAMDRIVTAVLSSDAGGGGENTSHAA
ncbi:MAG: UDP-N-acetylmuramoyl-tripeptide--D-alanyl-D-alanine ligase [Pseudoxanthomonas sp.]